MLAAAGLGILLQSPSWAASGPQPASGTFLITSSTVDSARVADDNTILVIALTGNATRTFDGRFTETDYEVIHPDGNITLLGTGTQFGTLGHMRHRVRPVRDRAAGNRLCPQRPVHRPGGEHIDPDQDPFGRQLDG